MNSILATLGIIASSPFLFFSGNADIKAEAQVRTQQSENANSELVCTDLDHNLYLGVRDRKTDGEVTELKNFLRAEGYLNGNNSGTFNVPTMRAVMEFQGEADITPTGFVGPLTRAEIEEITCDDDEENDELAITSVTGPTVLDEGEEGTWTVNVEGDDLGDLRYRVEWGDEGWSPLRLFGADDDNEQAEANFTHTYSDAGDYTPQFTVIDEDGNEVSKDAATVTVAGGEDTLAISSITPASGEVGTTVTLEGEGFDGMTSVVIGGKAGANLDVDDDSTLTFTVPSLNEGTYRVAVKSDEGRSNFVHFKVTDDDSDVVGKVSISGVDAPTSLEAGEEGTWTIHAASNLSGNLTYSVDWGDYGEGFRALFSSDVETQSEASFTHTYHDAGTYKPKFTVTDADGNKASVGASVVIIEDNDD